jgi:2,3-bisphosphoglycerate-dependent phosphoglycerate mutase
MLSRDPSWPRRLWIVRHGESAGNVARDHAEANQLPEIAIEGRDMDVPLSATGQRQADALGRWFAALAEEARPTVILSSTYARSHQTAKRLAAALPGVRGPTLDERLREKELGTFDRLTRTGITARFPAESERRAQLGKFYYRPPGGESWCDVILRLRGLVGDMQLRYRGERVVVVAHQVTVLCLRYLIEEMDEATILAIDAAKDVANCSVTWYAPVTHDDGREALELRDYNFVAPLEDAGAPVTTAPDAKAPR